MAWRWAFVLAELSLLVALRGPDGWDVRSAPASRSSLLVITVDTLRADYVTAYDPRRGATRHMDRIGQAGYVFERAFAHTPLTLPSHTSIFTGLPPTDHGVHDNAGFRVRDDLTTMAEWLKRHGYATAAFIGAFPLDKRFGLAQGFDVYDQQYAVRSPRRIFFAERKAEAVVDAALAWLARQTGDRPWFLWVHLFDPHQPYDPPAAYRTGPWAQDPYGGEVAYTDDQVGRLLDELRRRQAWDRTLVVLTADHGESLGEHGEPTHGLFAYNATLHVPLLIHRPELQGTRRVPWPVSHADLFPTVCGLLGLPVPKTVRGRNLAPFLEDPQGRPPETAPIYIEALAAYLNRNWAPIVGVIDRGMKFIDTPIPELYDLQKDFHELTNLAPRSDLTPYRRTLQAFLRPDRFPRPTPETAETLEILRSLGYAAGGTGLSRKKTFTPDDDPKRLVEVHRMFLRALELHERGQSPEAIDLLKQVITRRRDMVVAYTNLVIMYRDVGDTRNAVLAAQAGLRAVPGSPELLSQLGQALVEAGYFEDGIRTLRQAAQLQATDPDVWNYLGFAYWRTDRFQPALEAFQRALRLTDADPLIYNNLGNLYLSMKRYADAEQTFRKALQLDPHLAAAYNGYAAARLAQGAWEDAYRAWQKALAADPDYAMAHYNLGVELYRRGRKQEARSHLLRYLELMGPRIPAEEHQKIEQMLRDTS